MAGMSLSTGLSQTDGLSAGNGLATGTGLSFDGFTPPTPPVISNGILLEGSLVDFLMLEDGTSYLLQE